MNLSPRSVIAATVFRMKLKVVPEVQPWYEDGLRFTCTQCGNCCTGGPGYIWITPEELERLAAHLKLSAEETVRKYCRNVSGRFSLKEKLRDGLHDCIFLQEVEVTSAAGQGREKRLVCSVYPVRPLQCRTWPFWEGNLVSPENWERAGGRCPGLGKGKLHNRKQIETIRDAVDWR